MKKINYLFLFVFLFSPLISYGALTDNLISNWNLNEESGGRLDSTSSNNDLTDNNTVLFGTGIIGNGADFELSTSESLSILDASQTGLDITGDISLSTWIKLESSPATDESYTVVAKFLNTGNQRSYMFRYADVSTVKQLIFQPGSGAGSEVLAINQALNTDVFYHVVWVWDASASSVEIFLNGVSIGTDTGAITSLFSGTSSFEIGSTFLGTTGFFDGLIDEVSIWDRLLTSDEVENLYNSGVGCEYPFVDDCVSEEEETSGISTSTINQTQQNILMGVFVFFFALCFGIYLIKKN